MPRKPAVEVTPDGRLYYVDHRNGLWRVQDVAFGPPHARPHQRRRLAPGDGRAGYRYFVSESGEQRSYRFTVDNNRDVTVEVLDSQLRRAEHPARGPFDGARHYTP